MYLIKYESGLKYGAFETKENAIARLTKLIDNASEFAHIYKQMYIQFDPKVRGYKDGYLFI